MLNISPLYLHLISTLLLIASSIRVITLNSNSKLTNRYFCEFGNGNIRGSRLFNITFIFFSLTSFILAYYINNLLHITNLPYLFIATSTGTLLISIFSVERKKALHDNIAFVTMIFAMLISGCIFLFIPISNFLHITIKTISGITLFLIPILGGFRFVEIRKKTDYISKLTTTIQLMIMKLLVFWHILLTVALI